MSGTTALIKRLVTQMLDDIGAFEAGRLPIHRLSSRLLVQLAALEQGGANPAWVESLRTLRNQVEQVNAFFLNSGRTRLTGAELQEALEVLNQMRMALIADS